MFLSRTRTMGHALVKCSLSSSIAVLGMVVFILGGVGIHRLAATREANALALWQARENTVAETQGKHLSHWLGKHKQVVAGLAKNLSLQLYLTELNLNHGDETKITDAEAQKGYLYKLLKMTAKQKGFGNTRIPGNNGLALLDKQNRVIMKTETMPEHDAFLNIQLSKNLAGYESVGPYLNDAGKPVMAFMAPIFAVQGNTDPASRIGVAVGITELSQSFYPLLTAGSFLVQVQGNIIEQLLPHPNGIWGIQQVSKADLLDVRAFVVRSPGAFTVKGDSHYGKILTIGARMAQAPSWMVVRQVAWSDVMQNTFLYQRVLWMAYGVGWVCITLLSAAVICYRRMVKAKAAAMAYKQSADRYWDEKQLLELVLDAQPHSILMTDENNRCRYANKAANQRLETECGSILKSLEELFAEAQRADITSANRKAITKELPIATLYSKTTGQKGGVILQQTVHMPFAYVPVSSGERSLSGVLLVESNVEIALHETVLGQILAMLILLSETRIACLRRMPEKDYLLENKLSE